MENEKDWFTEGWAEDGGVIPDEREAEELPPEDSSKEGAALPETGEGPEAGTAEQNAPREGRSVPPMGGPVRTEEERQADLVRFVTEYPDVDAVSIPRSVWRRASTGESLVTAYARYEAEALREENRRLRESEANRRRSAGSQLGVAAGAKRADAFDSGWESAY